jgi:protein involved in polysaccharide export with SLBB domain
MENVPVGPGYLLGPGDEIKLNVWGKMNGDYTYMVDRDGKIIIPDIGVVHIAGLTFSETKEFLEKEFSRYYKKGEVKINVSMGRLRTIRVFVVGKAERPGSYTVSSLSTLINGLFAANGPSKVGTMRDIQVKRNGKTVVHFDLYEFLLAGDKTKDIRLMPEDVIFIPTVGPLVGIAGNVKVPAIYELKGETTLRELIRMAGGLSATGYPQRIQVERVFEKSAKIIQDINLEELSEEEDIVIRDGDMVRVFAITERLRNPVELKGNVVRSGIYEWREGIHIGDLIVSMEDLLPDTFFEFALVERIVLPDYHKEYLFFNLGELVMEGNKEEDISLMPNDTVVVFNKWDLMERERVRVMGAVNKPGEYEYRSRMRLSDLLKLAGGLKRYAFNSGEVTRIIPYQTGPQTYKFTVDLRKALEGEVGHDIPLHQDDYLFVRAVPEWELYRVVSIEGEVRFPGTYTIKKGERISSLIERADGYTEKAYLKGAVFTRDSVRELQQKRLEESIERLEQMLLAQSAESLEAALSSEEVEQQKAMMDRRRALIAKMKAAKAKGRISIKLDSLEYFKGSRFDIPLEEGDRLVIPERPSQVQVIGAVYNQNAFLHDQEAEVSSYIKSAGGLTKDANEDEIYVLKVDGTAISKKEGSAWGASFMSSRLDPGDTIVVPKEIDTAASFRRIKDITQILYQIAITTGVFIAVF